MKKQMKSVIAIGACALVAGALGAWAGPEDKEGQQECALGASNTCPAFEQLKTLAGDWVGKDADGDGKPDTEIHYKVISAGSVVMETIFPGSAHEMVTMYHMNGPELLVTHYCAAGNQPRMKAQKTDDRKKIVFTFKDGTNLDPSKDLYMGALTVKFTDEGRFVQEWTHYEDGKAAEPTTFEWTRVKAAAAR